MKEMTSSGNSMAVQMDGGDGGGDSGAEDEGQNAETEDECLKPINGSCENNAKVDSGLTRSGGKRQSLILRRGDTDLSIDHSGLQRFLPQFMQFAFADREAEQLYRDYYENEKCGDFKTLIVIVLIVNLVLLLLYLATFSTRQLPQMIVLVCSLVVALIALVLSLRRRHQSSGAVSSKLWTLIPFVVWSVQIAHLFCDLWLYSDPRMPSDSVSWVLLYTYSIYVIFPLRLRVCGTLALTMAFIHLAFVGVNPKTHEMFVNQVS